MYYDAYTLVMAVENRVDRTVSFLVQVRLNYPKLVNFRGALAGHNSFQRGELYTLKCFIKTRTRSLI